ITAPEYACPTRTAGPLVRSSAQLKAVASLVKDVSGIGAQVTLRPRRSRGRTILLQQYPSAHAAWTRTIVEFWGNSPILAACPGKLSVKESSKTTPRDAVVS